MGKLDLNSIAFNEHLTREDIFNIISQEDIYSFYIREKVESGDRLHSPLREDNVPSFGIYYHKHQQGILMFKDYATGDCGDAIIFVCKLFNITYYEALMKIAFDFNLTSLQITDGKKYYQTMKKVVQKEQVKLGIKIRNWQIKDKSYWSSFGITKRTLIKYNVFPISYVFFNGDAYKADDLAYAYAEFKDNIPTYKIYQPFSKKFKWINNANYSVHQGYSQLPSKGELLIITKSLKDVMSIRDVLRVPSIGLQSESVMMKDSVMEEYKSRFKKVVCLFDNDNAGINLSEQFSEYFNVPYFLLPNINDTKDFSDLVKEVGKEKARQIFTKELNKLI